MNDGDTHDQILQAADDLFYRQGFDHTSFADIAGSVGISRGNFYYHFKSKDEILDGVITRRLAQTRDMIDRWEAAGDTPEDRIRAFIDILTDNADDIRSYGCPVGTLTSELAKLGHPSQSRANELFTIFRVWLARQFERMGRGPDADALALHILARSQGIATLANAFKDDEFVRTEVQDMYAWLRDQVARAADRSGGGNVHSTP
ncbi:MAG: TetR/AcrR family transcriptional regulator [Alphaproteobacteria bacterium]